MSKFIMKMSKVIRKVGRVDEKLEELEIIPTLPILELELAEQFKHWPWALNGQKIDVLAL